MDGRISILDVEMRMCFAKEALKEAITYMETEPVDVIRVVTATELMKLSEDPVCKEQMQASDMTLPGDCMVLDAAKVRERRILLETEDQTFLKMLLRYLHKRHARSYVLAESDEDMEACCGYLRRRFGGIRIVGSVVTSEEDRADDRMVNAINGQEAACVVSLLGTPLQESFLRSNRNRLDVRVWLGAQESLKGLCRKSGPGPLERFIIRHIFKKELEKSLKEDS